MRILMLAPEPFFEPRGTPISVLQRLSALTELGYQVDLVTYHVGVDLELPNVRILRIPNIPFIKSVGVGPSWAKPLLDGFLFFRALFLLLTRRYDVIHSHEEAAFMAVLFAFVFRTHHVYDMHSSLPRQLENFNFGNVWPLVKLFEWLEWLTLRTCDVVITVGDDLEERVRQVNPGAVHHKIENISLYANFVPPPQAVQQRRQELEGSKRPLIVYTGTFEPYQGLPMLIESARLVRERFPLATFVLVGGLPEQVKALRQQVRDAGLVDNFLFTGSVPPVEALTYAEMADLLVSPRISGTSVPLKVYSYLQAGKPIVATRIEAHTQVLDQETALLVDVSSESLAEGITQLLTNPQLGLEMGRRAKQLGTQQYSLPNLVSRVEAAYRPFW